MINPADIYHTGLAVPDLDEAKRFYTASLGYEFAPDHLYEPLRLWRMDLGRWTEEWLRVTYSRQGPHHLELVEGRKGGFWDPDFTPNAQHVGLWCDDLPTAIEQLASSGWTYLASRGHPDDGYGDFAYLANQTSHAAIELVSTNAKARITAWFSEV